jgi:hypothetical protein
MLAAEYLQPLELIGSGGMFEPHRGVHPNAFLFQKPWSSLPVPWVYQPQVKPFQRNGSG